MRFRTSTFVVLCLASGAFAAEFHVSPRGDDRAAGSPGAPFATLARARDAVREARRERPAEAVTVWIHGGDHLLGSPLELGPEDSGVEGAPVTWRGVDGDRPRLLGARPLRDGDLVPVTDPATLARLAPDARGKVVAVDVDALGLRNVGPYPDVFSDAGGIVSLYTAERRLPVARFPDRGFMTIRKIRFNAGGATDGNWNGVAWHVLEDHPTGGIFEYREEFAAKHATWAGQVGRGVWLKGYWRIPWQNEAIRVAAIDPAEGTVTLAKPIPGGIGNKYTRPEGNGRESYWVMNLLEELDRPGEWALDFVDRRLYLWPPESADGARETVFVGDSTEAVVTLRDASHVTLRGLLVTVNAGPGIRVVGGRSVRVAGCAVRLVDDYAVRLEGGRDHEVRSSDLSQLGAGGVWVAGGDEESDPPVSSGHVVLNNHIHHFSQVTPVYTPGVNAGFTGGGNGGHHVCVGVRIAHNLIHDTPHAGILLGSLGHVVEFNEVFRFATVSNDMGGVYAYDRVPRFGGHVVRHNYFHSSGEGDAVYWDHDHEGITVFGNVVRLRSSGIRGTAYLYKIGSQATVPQSIRCENNVAIDSNVGFEFVTALPGEARIANNVAVRVGKPFRWSVVRDGRAQPSEPFASGPLATYDEDPGFVDLEGGNLALRPDSRVFADLPGFQPIPFDQIGLFVDEYRPVLPDPAFIDREGRRVDIDALEGYQILDRK